MQEAIKQANEQLGGSWRLPTAKNLKALYVKHATNQKSTQIFSHLLLLNLIGHQIKITGLKNVFGQLIFLQVILLADLQKQAFSQSFG